MKRRPRRQLTHTIVAVVEPEAGPADTTNGNLERRRRNAEPDRKRHCVDPWPAIILEDSDEKAERYTHGSIVIEIGWDRD